MDHFELHSEKEKRNKIQVQDILIIVAMAAVISLSEQAPLPPS